MTDYAAMYNTYWSDPSRWGTSSLRDVEATAETILDCCGGGRVLDVGSGMGALVRTLLKYGVDAIGLDVADRCVQESSRAAPGRFVQGSMLDLPFPDGSFDTVASTDVLEHLEEGDVPRAIAEMARIARRSLFIRVATTPDRDGAWHLTVRDRAWWERTCFEAGLRRHPMMLAAVGYEALEAEGWQATLVLEKIPAEALRQWPLDSLRAERNLHMDMLREAGRRSDAHLARYWMACQHIRPGDAVLDAACGLGYGAAVLAAGSQASRITGVDESAFAIDYAAANYGTHGAASTCPIEFRRGDAADLSWLADHSIDAVVSFETLEHLPEPGRFLDEVRRVLRPGGRIIASVPNRWVDDSGRDPNPHHLHIYDWDRLAAELRQRFILEKRYAQVAGGGLTLREGTRRLRDVAIPAPGSADPTQPGPGKPEPEPRPEQAEWWLAVAMKDPVGAPRDGYTDTGLPDHSATPGFNVSAFGRDYENPWLVRAMVALGLRTTNRAELAAMASRVLEHAQHGEPAASSADVGAALCVLGYRLIENGSTDAAHADEWLAQASTCERAVDSTKNSTPHARRWVISNAYLAGQILLATGRRDQALQQFRRCAAMDVLPFSPLLASKTIDASWQAGVIAACDGDIDAAITDFRRGLSELVRILAAGDWTNIIGSIDHPLPFGLVDLQQGVEFASRCAFGVELAPLFRDRPGLAWQLVRRRSMADLKRWTEQQTGAIEWLREQRRVFEKALSESREWISRQEKGRQWLEQNSANLSARLESLTREAGDERERLRGAIEELKRGTEWQAAQRRELEQRLRERDATLTELRAFLESQRATTEDRLKQKDARIAELQAAVARLTETRDWALRQRDAFKAKAEKTPASGPRPAADKPAPQ